MSPASPIVLTRPMLIGGKWVEAASGEVLNVENPARRQVIAHVPRGSAPDVDLAVEDASAAFSTWSKVVPRDQGLQLLRIADALESRLEEIARTIALETGNALRTQARPEAKLAAESEAARRTEARTTSLPATLRSAGDIDHAPDAGHVEARGTKLAEGSTR